jgi:hypothetical protein
MDTSLGATKFSSVCLIVRQSFRRLAPPHRAIPLRPSHRAGRWNRSVSLARPPCNTSSSSCDALRDRNTAASSSRRRCLGLMRRPHETSPLRPRICPPQSRSIDQPDATGRQSCAADPTPLDTAASTIARRCPDATQHDR